jgi:hypothetical protein
MARGASSEGFEEDFIAFLKKHDVEYAPLHVRG